MEASALTHTSSMPGLRGPSALLRLQSDERLIALTRKGNHAAFEVLCTRYQARLLAFCRHMLSSKEDAEDVLQEVFAAAFNAVLADEREINVRPWLYRIARNRSLNHLRRTTSIGVDTMDVHFAEGGLSTTDKVMRRENFRELIADVQELPETQRTALLLREIDALSYEQIAHAMETTVPSVKSLLVRARISLAEAAEARKLSCEEVRLELGESAEGLGKISTARPPARARLRTLPLLPQAAAGQQQGAGRDLPRGAPVPRQETSARQARFHRLRGRRPRRRWSRSGNRCRRERGRRCGSRRRRRRRAGQRCDDRRRRSDRHQGRRRARRRRHRHGRRRRRRPRLRHAARHPRLALRRARRRPLREDASIVVHQQAQPASRERAPAPRAHRPPRGRRPRPRTAPAGRPPPRPPKPPTRRPPRPRPAAPPPPRAPPSRRPPAKPPRSPPRPPSCRRRPPPSPTPPRPSPPRP